ncbi:MAG: hypothetical protein Fur0018_19650 [Anaerolineales bacterium]
MINDMLPKSLRKRESPTGGLQLPEQRANGHKPSVPMQQNQPKQRLAASQERHAQELPDAFWDVDLEQVLSAPQGYAYEISLDVFFNARHAVVTDGTRGVVHAHSYRLAATFRAQILSKEEAFAVGYQELRERIKQVASAYNNTLLNSLPPFRKMQPTTEALSAVIYQQIQRLITKLPVELVRVTVYESPTEAVAFQRVQESDPQVDVKVSTTEQVTFQRSA